MIRFQWGSYTGLIEDDSLQVNGIQVSPEALQELRRLHWDTHAHRYFPTAEDELWDLVQAEGAVELERVVPPNDDEPGEIY